MSPTPRTAFVVVVVAVAALAVPLPVAVVALAALAGAVVADLLAVREAPAVRRDAPRSVALDPYQAGSRQTGPINPTG